MQDRKPPDRRNLLRRTAGPYIGSISAIELRVRHGRTCFDTGRQRAQLLDCIRLLQPSMVGSITPATGAPPVTGRHGGRPWRVLWATCGSHSLVHCEVAGSLSHNDASDGRQTLGRQDGQPGRRGWVTRTLPARHPRRQSGPRPWLTQCLRLRRQCHLSFSLPSPPEIAKALPAFLALGGKHCRNQRWLQ